MPVSHRAILRLEAAVYVDPVPLPGVADIVEQQVVLLGPEERNSVKALARPQHVARRRLTLAFSDDPMLDANGLAGKPVGPPGDVARRKDTGNARLQVLVDECDKLGASRVFVFDHNVRNAAREGLAQPSRQVHNDHTVNSAPRRVRDHMGAEAEELLKHRFGIVNVWRPIRGPVQDSPLALCDARSFTDDDLIASDLVYAHVRGETSRVEYNPGHRWYYFSDMQPDEVLFIRVHDSANDGRARLSFHTSFDNPLTRGAPPRESIEVRTLVFFPPAA
jgi:hypothetical protein